VCAYQKKMKGNRRILYRNGDKYFGKMKDVFRHGYGNYIFKNGDSYRGNYFNNIKEGKGIYFFKCGDRYNGEFLKDLKHGKGEYYFGVNKKTLKGLWKKDILVQTNRKDKILREISRCKK